MAAQLAGQAHVLYEAEQVLPDGRSRRRC
ncbi:hypothetical protein HaLaN_27402 [Haematococcus lacustris]|uniref:Uncharacterized protein n=1 Tax=Haematococcus lacustris TaxID=44745 RepID=A0A6A0A9V8_HAELA|nr:hypothetical protein HaLaN_27402 [Haematococcus lacustris]